MTSSEEEPFKMSGRQWFLLALIIIGWLGSAAWGFTAPRGKAPTYGDLGLTFVVTGILFVTFFTATARLSEKRFGHWIAGGVVLVNIASNLVFAAIAHQKGYQWMQGAIFPFLGASGGWQIARTVKSSMQRSRKASTRRRRTRGNM